MYIFSDTAMFCLLPSPLPAIISAARASNPLNHTTTPNSDLMSVPNDLRVLLEAALQLEPSPESLLVYNPKIRDVIVILLQGLKSKQAIYRRRVQEQGNTTERVSSVGSAFAKQPKDSPQPRDSSQQRNSPQAKDLMAARQSYSSNVHSHTQAPSQHQSFQPSGTNDFGGIDPRSSHHSGNSQHAIYSTYDSSRHAQRPRSPLQQPATVGYSSANSSSNGRPSREHRPLPATSRGGVGGLGGGGLPSRPLPRDKGPLPPPPPDAFKPTRQGRLSPSPSGTDRFSFASSTPSQTTSALPVPTRPTLAPLSGDPGSNGGNGFQPSSHTSDAPFKTAASQDSATITMERHSLVDNPMSPNEGSPQSHPIVPTAIPITPPPRRKPSAKSSLQATTDGAPNSVDPSMTPPHSQPASRFSLDSEMDSPMSRRRMSIRPESMTSTPRADLNTSTFTVASPRNLPPLLPLLPPLPPLAPPDLTMQSPNDKPVDPLEAEVKESPAVIASLSALQKSEALGRRASKRYSQYQYKQLIPNHGKTPSHTKSSSIVDGMVSPQRPRKAAERDIVPPLPPMPEIHQQAPTEGTTSTPSVILEAEEDQSNSSMRVYSDVVKVFLQYGRETKRVSLDLKETTTIADLQAMFVSKFDYSPDGMELFPDVYIKEPSTGVTYQLEDMDDIKTGTLLSLNIDPLDQVKQHFDNTITALSHEIKDLKTNLANSRRYSVVRDDHRLSPSLLAAPTEHSPVKIIIPTAISSPMPGGGASPTPGAPTTNTDFTHHYEEIQNLRRDLGVMRQTYVDFVTSTKETFTTLREQTQAVREVALSKLKGSRGLVDAAKTTLEKQSSDTVQAVEEVSDIIDSVKQDVLRRQIMPRGNEMGKMKEDLANAKARVEKLKEQVSLAGASWKQTWNQELKNVVEEQHLLQHQEKLAQDLQGDINEAGEMFDMLREYVAQRQNGMNSARRQIPPRQDPEQASVPNLLLEIRTKDLEAESERRVKAIERQQEQRQREIANKSNDFADELTGFVIGRKLKKTGGTEEAERVRARKQEHALKKIFDEKSSGPTSNVTSGTSSPVAVSTPIKVEEAPVPLPEATNPTVKTEEEEREKDT